MLLGLPARPPTWHPDRSVGPRLTRPDQSPKPQSSKNSSCHSRRLLLSFPQVPLLSFPQVFSGNPSWQRCGRSSIASSAAQGPSLSGCPITTVGHDREQSQRHKMPPYELPARLPNWHPDRSVGPRLTRPDQSPKPQSSKNSSCHSRRLLLSFPQVPLLSFPQVFSGNPSWQRCGRSSIASSAAQGPSLSGCPITTVGHDREQRRRHEMPPYGLPAQPPTCHSHPPDCHSEVPLSLEGRSEESQKLSRTNHRRTPHAIQRKNHSRQAENGPTPS